MIPSVISSQVQRGIEDFLRTTFPGGPRERTITYEPPFDRNDREADYATAWKASEQRGIG